NELVHRSRCRPLPLDLVSVLRSRRFPALIAQALSKPSVSFPTGPRPLLTLTGRTEGNTRLSQPLGRRLVLLPLRVPCAPALRARAGSTAFAIPEQRARIRETRSESTMMLSSPSFLRRQFLLRVCVY